MCAIKDAFSNRIVGYSIDPRMKARRAVQAIENAVGRREDVAGCILHTDRGSQFRARKVHRTRARHRMVGSMGQVGSAGDNAAMESSFALLQKNVLNRRSWSTRDELRIAIVTWTRADLPPASTPSGTRPIDPGGIRNHHDPGRRSGGVRQPVTGSCSRPVAVMCGLARPS